MQFLRRPFLSEQFFSWQPRFPLMCEWNLQTMPLQMTTVLLQRCVMGQTRPAVSAPGNLRVAIALAGYCVDASSMEPVGVYVRKHAVCADSRALSRLRRGPNLRPAGITLTVSAPLKQLGAAWLEICLRCQRNVLRGNSS